MSDLSKQEMHLRAADYYARLSKPFSEWKKYADLENPLRRFDHLFTAKDYSTAMDLLIAMSYDYLILWGFSSVVVSKYDALVAQVPDEKLKPALSLVTATAYYEMGKHNSAIDLLYETISRHDNDLNSIDLAFAYSTLANTYRVVGNLALALENFTKASEINVYINQKGSFSTLIDGRLLSYQIARGLANTYRNMMRVQEALDTMSTGYSDLKGANDNRMIATHYTHVGVTLREAGRFQEARNYLERGHNLAAQEKYAWRECVSGGEYGLLLYYKGDFDRAIELLETSHGIAMEIQARRFFLSSSINLARIELIRSRHTRVHEIHESIVTLIESHSSAKVLQSYYMLRAELAFRDEDYFSAKDMVDTARTYDVPQFNHAVLSMQVLVSCFDGNFAPQMIIDAEQEYSEILTLTPNHWYTLYSKALTRTCEVAMGRLEIQEAQNAYLEAIDNCRANGILHTHHNYLRKLTSKYVELKSLLTWLEEQI